MDVGTPAALVELMTKAKAGDKEAFSALYHHSFVPVYRYLFKRVHEPSVAEDLAQSVFVKVYTSTTAFTAKASSPLAYLFTVAKHALIDYWKKQNRTTTLALESDEMMEKIAIDSRVETNNRLAVFSALNTLPSEQKQVLELKFWQGLGTHEIAVKLNKTEMAIRQIQCRALRALRAQLSDQKSTL